MVAGVPTADFLAENQAAQVIAPTLTVTDVDGTTLLQATVTITANYGRRPRRARLHIPSAARHRQLLGGQLTRTGRRAWTTFGPSC